MDSKNITIAVDMDTTPEKAPPGSDSDTSPASSEVRTPSTPSPYKGCSICEEPAQPIESMMRARYCLTCYEFTQNYYDKLQAENDKMEEFSEYWQSGE